MLSRHAEDLFWIGRYIERAEDTARMLDVTYHTLLESPPVNEESAWRELLEVLHLAQPFDQSPTAQAVKEFLVWDRSNPGSVVAAVGRARENARGVRDRISTELWEAINRFHLDLVTRDLPAEVAQQPYELLRAVRERCQLVSGVMSETMSRDDGYRFITLGVMLERAEMTCRLLEVRYTRLANSGRQMGFHAWLSVLKSVSAFEAYLKEHRASLDPIRVLEFLLSSPVFPRSVLYSMATAERLIIELADDDIRPAVVRLAGRVRALIEFAEVEEVLADGLDEWLKALREAIYDVASAADEHFFRAGTELDLHAYESV